MDRINQIFEVLWKTVVPALQAGFFFFVAFLLVGEPILLSLILALVGGLAGAWISSGWIDAEQPSPQEQASAEAAGKQEGVNDVAYAKTRFREWRKQQYQRRRSSWMFWKNPRKARR